MKGNPDRPDAGTGSTTETGQPQALVVRTLGDFPSDLLPSGVTPERTVPVVRDHTGRVAVQGVVREHRQAEGAPPLLLLTSHDLFLPGCSSLFGFASAQDRVAIVSAYRLGGDGTEMLRKRLANVIAHERGHLTGLRHCKTRGCLMSPAATAEDIDGRSQEPCGRCPRTSRRFVGAVAALAVLCLLIAALDASATVIRVRKQPFAWHAAGASASLFFKDTPLLTLGADRASSPVQRAESMTRSLNQLFLEIHPAALVVQAKGPDAAVIRAGDLSIVDVFPSDAGGRPAVQIAEQWAAEIQPLLKGKGFASESCPGCHIKRIGEIDHELSTKGMLRR